MTFYKMIEYRSKPSPQTRCQVGYFLRMYDSRKNEFEEKNLERTNRAKISL